MRLTEALIQKSPQVTNPMQERELDLRGVGLQKMDETVLSKIAEDFDVLNLCDNQITTLDAFPQMDRLTTLMLHKNNVLSSVSAGVSVRTPNLHTFVANGCGFSTLSALNFLAGWPLLQRVSFSNCPLYDSLAQTLFTNAAAIPQPLKGLKATEVIRLYIIAVCSTGQFTASVTSSFNNCPLKLIDFDRVLDAERAKAKALKAELLALPQLLASLKKGAVGSSSDAASAAAPAAPQYAADGTRIRKRGREAAAASGIVTADGGIASSVAVAADASSAGPSSAADAQLVDEVTEEEIDRRTTALNERLEVAETEEDLNAIEMESQELDRLRALLAARKAKKSRSGM